MDGRRRMNKDPLEKGQRRTEKGRHLLQRRGGGERGLQPIPALWEALTSSQGTRRHHVAKATAPAETAHLTAAVTPSSWFPPSGRRAAARPCPAQTCPKNGFMAKWVLAMVEEGAAASSRRSHSRRGRQRPRHTECVSE